MLLAYDYASRRALLRDAEPGPVSPHLYTLCHPCGDRLRPPLGWVLEDLRRSPPLFCAGQAPMARTD